MMSGKVLSTEEFAAAMRGAGSLLDKMDLVCLQLDALGFSEAVGVFRSGPAGEALRSIPIDNLDNARSAPSLHDLSKAVRTINERERSLDQKVANLERAMRPRIETSNEFRAAANALVVRVSDAEKTLSDFRARFANIEVANAAARLDVQYEQSGKHEAQLDDHEGRLKIVEALGVDLMTLVDVLDKGMKIDHGRLDRMAEELTNIWPAVGGAVREALRRARLSEVKP